MARQNKTRPAISLFLTCVGLLLVARQAEGKGDVRAPQPNPNASLPPTQEMLRLSQNIPGDSQPIILHADEISTWMEGTERVILLKGTVLLENGVVYCRAQGGVAWVDPARTRETGILHLDFLGEGTVRLEQGPVTQAGQRAFVDLNTRGGLKLQSHAQKVIQQPRRDDPLFRRACAGRPKDASPADPGTLQRVSSPPAPVGPPVSPATPQPGPATQPPSGWSDSPR